MSTVSRNIALLFLSVWLITGCKVGEKASNVEIARNPEGESIRLNLGKNRDIECELLSFQNSTFIFLLQSRVTSISAEWVKSIQLLNRGGRFIVDDDGSIRKEKNTSGNASVELQAHARYPQGINKELLSIKSQLSFNSEYL